MVNSKKRAVRLCPRCKKPMSHPAFNVSGFMAPRQYTCLNCGYTGALFIDVNLDEVDPEDLKKILAGEPAEEGADLDANDADKDNDDFGEE